MKLRHYNESEIEEIQDLFASVFGESEGETEGALIKKLSKDLLEKTKQDDLFVVNSGCERLSYRRKKGRDLTNNPCNPPEIRKINWTTGPSGWDASREALDTKA